MRSNGCKPSKSALLPGESVRGKNRRLRMSNHGQTFFGVIAAIIASTIGFAITLI